MQRGLLPDELLCDSLAKGELFCLVAQGALRATTALEDGRAVFIRDLLPGDSVGDPALIDAETPETGTTPVIVAAVTPARILLAPAEFLRFYVANQAAFWLEESRYLNYCATRLTGRLVDLSAPSLSQRIAQFLCSSAQPRPDGSAEVKVSHEELGRAVRAHRCSVTRALQDLGACGVVELGRRSIVVRNLDELRLAARTLE